MRFAFPFTYKTLPRIPIGALTLATLLVTSGCSKQLLGSLDEMSANQVVSALRLEGVAADKSSEGESGWKVTVPNEQFAEAVQTLGRRNLPPQPFQGLGQVFKKESLVSTPTEERARLIYAISQELERSLMEIGGVLVARVHPVIAPQDPLNPKKIPVSASVLIKYRPGADMTGREAMIRSLVAAGVEGLNYDDVRVVMVPAEMFAADDPAKPSPRADGRGQNLLDVAREFFLTREAATLAFSIVFCVLAALWFARMRRISTVRKKHAAGVKKDRLAGRWAETVGGSVAEHAGRPAGR